MKFTHTKRYDYRIRIQVAADSTEAVLLEYLRDGRNHVFSHKEMVLSAFRAYWLPAAYESLREQGQSISDEDLARLAYNAMHLLRERADMLEQRFCLGTGQTQQPLCSL